MISGHSRDIGYLIILSIWNIGIWRKEKKLETGGNCLAPSVSVKDRTVVGPADHVRNVLTACRE